MKFKSLIVLIVLFLSINSLSATNKHKKHKKEKEEISFIEANVISGSGDCGYLLQLSNGIILKPSTSIPKKFQDNHLKVLVRYNEVSGVKVQDACGSTKVITVTDIKKYKPTGQTRAKY
jgi:hypothetical protein